jgi:hypothetical protein
MLLLTLLSLHSAAIAGSICNDGWVSPSEGQGACSHHGGVERLCGGYEQIGKGVFARRPQCPFKRYQDNAAGDYVSVFTKMRADQWQLALEQSRMEIDAGQITPDQFITRAREIMVENWGSPAEQAALAEKKATIERAKKLADSIISRVGKDHLSTWLRYVEDPGVCWTIDTDAILFKTVNGAIITLRKEAPARMSTTQEDLASYAALVELNSKRSPTDGEICNESAPEDDERPDPIAPRDDADMMDW